VSSSIILEWQGGP